MSIWERFWALIRLHTILPCPVCGRDFDITHPGGRVIIETWGPSGITLGKAVTTGTCKRCPGEWWDAGYVHHTTGDEPQVNSKPNHMLKPLRLLP